MSKLPELTREMEEEKLREVLQICKDRLKSVKMQAKALEQELHAMQQEFNESDKEQQVLWHNADVRFQEVRQEILRAGQTSKKPYFGRIDFSFQGSDQEEACYIGRNGISDSPGKPVVIDWRSPIASVYYEGSLGKNGYSVQGEGKMEVELFRKRTYVIENEVLKDFYDSEVVANDELLTKYLSKNKGAVLSEIIATIQAEQNEVIRMKPQHNIIIQGAAGSGKTTVAMHRISYILYNFDMEFKPEDFYVIGSNQVLLNYITGVLPELNVFGVRQMTMEQLFTRLIYEQWNPRKYGIKEVVKGVTEPVKGTGQWFKALEAFARNVEWDLIPKDDVKIERTNAVVMDAKMIKDLLTRFDKLSRADMVSLLNERLLGKLEDEISGKYYSYSEEEKKTLRRKFSQYFGRRKWNGSVFELYHDFLAKQLAEGIHVEEPIDEFDVYDLAALAYLYKRLIETEVIREAGHVVIDEAQDFGMMVYHSLKYCLSKCTYTIMGDVAQNIFMEYGLNDWQELRKVMLPDEFDYFGLLRKSYRNTIEISDFATKILQHGTFQVYPVQPIIRHGDAVKVLGCIDEKELIEKSVSIINGWKEKGFETIAVVCADWQEAERVNDLLGKRIPLLRVGKNGEGFGNGVAVLPLELTKGLEFDAVIIYDCSREKYPSTDGLVKRLYVAATRALHELAVLYQGELSGLIKDPIYDEQKLRTITEAPKVKKRFIAPVEDKTKEEIAREQAVLGEALMQERHYIGPKRIVVVQNDAGRDADDGKRRAMTPKKSKVSGAGVKMSSYLDDQLDRGVTGNIREQRKTEEKIIKSRKDQEFGSMPEQNELHVPGHSKNDHLVKMCIKGKNGIDLITGYSTIRIEPVSPRMIRVRAMKGAGMDFQSGTEIFPVQKAAYRFRETREVVEIATDLVKVVASKKGGELSFWEVEKGGKERMILTEKPGEPRFFHPSGNYVFWNWTKKENLYAKPPANQLPLFVGNSARVISFGKDAEDTPGLHSDQGYELWFPKGKKTMCCNIGVYGPYLYQEDNCLEYYFSLTSKN